MKNLTLITTILLTLSITSFADTAVERDEATILLQCQNNYTSRLQVQLKEGKVSFKLEAIGYVDHLEIADKLGLPEESLFSTLEFTIPESHCAFATNGRLSCSHENPILVFKNKAGATSAMSAYRMKIQTGQMGAGASSYQKVEFSISADHDVEQAHDYRHCLK